MLRPTQIHSQASQTISWRIVKVGVSIVDIALQKAKIDLIMAGYSGTPLAKKLGIEEQSRVLIVGAYQGFEEDLQPLPAGAKLLTRSTKPVDVIICFCKSRKELDKRLLVLIEKLLPAGGLWFSWPKKSSGVKTDLTEDTFREVVLPTGLVDNKVCAINETWSGLRFVRRLKNR